MVQGKAIPELVQWIVVRLSTSMSMDDVCMYTDVSKRSVERIMAHFGQTGAVMVPASKVKHQLQRALCDYDVEVHGAFVSFMSLINYHSICSPP